MSNWNQFVCHSLQTTHRKDVKSMLLNVGSGCGIYVAAAGGVVTAAAEALKGEAKEEGREADNDMVCSLFIIFITNG